MDFTMANHFREVGDKVNR